jgi:hypothetical protein
MRVLAFILMSALVFADVGLDQIENGFAKDDKDPKVLKISVLEYDKANQLFGEFIRDKSIPFEYPLEGCWARAMAMARIAEKESIQMGKVFVEGTLQAKTYNAKYPIALLG